MIWLEFVSLPENTRERDEIAPTRCVRRAAPFDPISSCARSAIPRPVSLFACASPQTPSKPSNAREFSNPASCFRGPVCPSGGMVDTRDLKSRFPRKCGFESRLGHQFRAYDIFSQRIQRASLYERQYRPRTSAGHRISACMA